MPRLLGFAHLNPNLLRAAYFNQGRSLTTPALLVDKVGESTEKTEHDSLYFLSAEFRRANNSTRVLNYICYLSESKEGSLTS